MVKVEAEMKGVVIDQESQCELNLQFAYAALTSDTLKPLIVGAGHCLHKHNVFCEFGQAD